MGFKDGSPSTALSTALHDGLLGTADSPGPTTRSGHSGLRRQVRLPQTSDTVASHGPDPPGGTSVQRCGETHLRRVDIRDLCQLHAHLSHGSAVLPQGPSGTNVSLELPDDHRHFIHPDHTASGQEINASAPSQVQTGVCPQSRPIFTRQTAGVRATQSRTATAPAATIPHHFWTQKMPFLRENKTPPTHHGQVAQRPQHVCLTQMHLLN